MEKLRDIHLPAAEAWWHLAWGWYVLLVFMMLLAAVMFYLFPYIKLKYRQKKQQRVLKQDIDCEFNKIRTRYVQGNDMVEVLSMISIFLRRVSVTLFKDEKSAGLIDEAWLKHLDAQWGEKKPEPSFNTPYIADLLKFGAYHQHLDHKLMGHVEALLDLTESWVKVVVKRDV